MISLDIAGWLVAAAGAMVAALALKSRGQYKDKASKAESRTEAVIEKRKTEDDVQKMDDDSVIAEFDRLREKRR